MSQDKANSDAEKEGLQRQKLPAGTLRVLQLTDTHLYADDRGKLLGVNTLDSFKSVIDEFKRHNWTPDLVLATGDLVHDASPDGYRKLRDMLDHFDCPVACLPGNHDSPLIMREELVSERVSCPQFIDSGAWRIVLLDSVIPGAVGGRLEDEQLAMLKQALEDTDRPTLITLHHQPVPIGSEWLDDMGVENGGKLMDLAKSFKQVKGILWGHVHQRFDRKISGIRMMASPSTCIQFQPESEDFALEEKQPGFRLLALLPDGSIKTRVLRTPSLPAGLDVDYSGGY